MRVQTDNERERERERDENERKWVKLYWESAFLTCQGMTQMWSSLAV